MAITTTKPIYDELSALFDEIEQQADSEVGYAYRDILAGDIIKFAVYLAGAEGDVSEPVRQYLCELTGLDIDETKMNELVARYNLSDAAERLNFAMKPLISFMLCICADNAAVDMGNAADSYERLHAFFKELGIDVISIDGKASVDEANELIAFLDSLSITAKDSVANPEFVFSAEPAENDRIDFLKEETEEEEPEIEPPELPADAETEEAPEPEEEPEIELPELPADAETEEAPVEEVTAIEQPEIEMSEIPAETEVSAEPEIELPEMPVEAEAPEIPEIPIAEPSAMSVEDMFASVSTAQIKQDNVSKRIEISIGENGSSYIAVMPDAACILQMFGITVPNETPSMLLGNSLNIATDGKVYSKNLVSTEVTSREIDDAYLESINTCILKAAKENMQIIEKNEVLSDVFEKFFRITEDTSAVEEINGYLQAKESRLSIQLNTSGRYEVVDAQSVVHSLAEILMQM